MSAPYNLSALTQALGQLGLLQSDVFLDTETLLLENVRRAVRRAWPVSEWQILAICKLYEKHFPQGYALVAEILGQQPLFVEKGEPHE